ncbi:CBS domain-containing protein [Parasulfitobacter algicola]|uniref:CBS domain-containing protein n=1 Tax=Parasulfitobacter algicola TaxID=2614809 RepID=A0ABX2ITQ8_9RHOB|nr:CBS domain-containing protein [Sulfitobacter algicola]NSX56307.1 CBS domain-containing protein [Sulfitobacter algicola]
MTVYKILQSKADETVITVTPDVTVSDAAGVLSAKRIGTVVISRDGKVAEGILSERDIVREIGKRGPSCLSEKVTSMMTTNIETCKRADRADDILKRMTDGRFRHMPVVENGEMVGLITIGDVVKMRLAELSMEKDALEGMIMGH